MGRTEEERVGYGSGREGRGVKQFSFKKELIDCQQLI